MQLHVDTRWCSKCKICRAGSEGRMKFTEDGYPIEGSVADENLRQIEKAVKVCPIGALSLT